MGIVQKTPQVEIEGYMVESIARVETALILSAVAAGEEGNNQARNHGNYTDQTGNLRSSTGYNVIVDGHPVLASDFETVKDGQEGSTKGEAFVRELVDEFPKGIAVVQVAGMPYASAVTNRGKDVLDTAEIAAQKASEDIMKKSGFEL